MKKHLLTTAATAVAMSAPSYAGNYITVFGGVNMLDDEGVQLEAPILTKHYSEVSTKTEGFLNTESVFVVTKSSLVTKHYTKSLGLGFDGDYDFDNGFVIGAALGCEVDAIPGLSVEGELAFRKNDLDLVGDVSIHYQGRKYLTIRDLLTTKEFTKTKQFQYGITFNTSQLTESTLYFSSTTFYLSTLVGDLGDGDITAFSIMANVWYELTGGSGPVTPFIGGGIGWAEVEVDLGHGISGDDSGLAWQVGVGVAYDLSDTSSIRIEYRRFQVNDLDIMSDGIPLGLEDYEANDIIIGFRMNF